MIILDIRAPERQFRFPLYADWGSITVGALAENELCLTARGVSRRHCAFVRAAGGWLLRDLGSTNGTRVNGKKVGEAPLRAGDEVRIGTVVVGVQEAPTGDWESRDGSRVPLPRHEKADAPRLKTEEYTGEHRRNNIGMIDSVPCPIGVSGPMKALWEDALRVKDSGLPILFLGETGTGKEVFARYLHGAGPRKNGPFIAVNCAAIPREMMEAELFGIEKNAATGVDFRQGKIELAHGGVLFLDEIGDLPPDLQAKVLRIFEQGAFHRLGGTREVKADARFMAATNNDLQARVLQGTFRGDLYYRLKGAAFHLPPLRERREDIRHFLDLFLDHMNAEHHTAVRFSKNAHAALLHHEWPGNLREMRNEVARAYHLARDGGLIQTRHLSFPAVSEAAGSAMGLNAAVEALEKEMIERALKESPSLLEAARLLQIPRSSLYNKIRQYDLKVPTEVKG